jgi:tRNA (Thr-GGU) A37 N-methylase
MDFTLTTIGLIHTPFTLPSETPIQSSRSKAGGWVEVFPEFAEGLQDIEAFSHLYLLYHFHQTDQINLLVEPFVDDRKHGIFATVTHSDQIILGSPLSNWYRDRITVSL